MGILGKNSIWITWGRDKNKHIQTSIKKCLKSHGRQKRSNVVLVCQRNEIKVLLTSTKSHIICIWLEITYHKGHWCFGLFAVFVIKLHSLFAFRYCNILLHKMSKLSQTISSSDTYILHHVVGFTLPFAQPPVQTQLQTSATEQRVYNIKVKHINIIWNFTSHLVVKSTVFPLQNFLNRSSRLLGNSSIISIVFTLTDSKLQPMYEYPLPFCWGRWQATD